MTRINFDRFQPLSTAFSQAASCDELFLQRRIRKTRSGEYRDESYGNLLLTGCQAAKSLLIDLLM